MPIYTTPIPGMMFTCTTFRTSAFDRYGALDPNATHFTWLYRWWSQAKARGISTTHLDYLGVKRRLHPSNSWTLQRSVAHQHLLGELRQLHHARRRGDWPWLIGQVRPVGASTGE